MVVANELWGHHSHLSHTLRHRPRLVQRDFKHKGGFLSSRERKQQSVFRNQHCSPAPRQSPRPFCERPQETPFYWDPAASQRVWSHEVCFLTFKCFDYWRRRKPFKSPEHLITRYNLSLNIVAKNLHESQDTNLLTTTCRPENSPVFWMIFSFKCVSSGRKKPVPQVKLLQQDTFSDAYTCSWWLTVRNKHCQDQLL